MRLAANNFETATSNAWLQVARIYKAMTTAVRYYNNSKSHAYYVKFKKIIKMNRRTKREKMRIIVTEVPSPNLTQREEYLVLTFYLTLERVLQRRDFEKRLNYILNELNNSPWNITNLDTHTFIYFIGYKFRAGVYERAKEIRKNIIRQGYNILLRLVELRYNNFIQGIVFQDIFQFLSSRFYKLINSQGFHKSNGKIFSRPKHFLDWIILILYHLGHNGIVKFDNIDYLIKMSEAPISEYKNLLITLEIGKQVIQNRLWN